MPPSKKEAAPDKQPKDQSDYAIVKEGGWGNRNNFMLSHGLKMHEIDHVQEANAILQAYRDIDQRLYEEKQQQGKGGK